MAATKQCWSCGLTRPLGDFPRTAKPDGQAGYCRLCNSRDQKISYRPKGAGRVYQMEEHNAQRNHVTAKARARALGAAMPPADDSAILLIYRASQWRSKATGIRHEVDHVIPLSLGGAHSHSNLQILTQDEHRVKTTADLAIPNRHASVPLGRTLMGVKPPNLMTT